VAIGFPAGGVVNVCNVAQQSVSLATGFNSPEAGQATTTVVTTNLPASRYTLSNTPGNPSQQVLNFIPIPADLNQSYFVTYQATDNSTCPLTTSLTVTINLDPAQCPTPAKRASWAAVKRFYR
jgi:hypothetical protein